MAGEAAPTIEHEQSSEENREVEKPISLLAAELFPNDYVGEVPEPEASNDAPVEDEEPEAADPVDEPDGDEPDGVPISSMQELIESNEWDPEWADGLKETIKVDGEAREVTRAELKKSYQMNQAADKRLTEAKSKAKAINQELAEKSEEVQGQLVVAAKLVGDAEALFDQDVKGVDWEKLREDDPAEYAAQKNDFTERRARIDQRKSEILVEARKITEKQSEETQKMREQMLAAESAALLEKLPEWNDPEKAKAEQASMSEYLLAQGFSKQDVAEASDHRLILLARKAMLFDDVANSDVAKKKVAKVPKVLKPGAPKSQDQVNKEKVEKARQRLQKSGSIDDAFALLKAKRGG